MIPPGYLTVSDIADKTNGSRRLVQRWLAAGLFPNTIRADDGMALIPVEDFVDAIPAIRARRTLDQTVDGRQPLLLDELVRADKWRALAACKHAETRLFFAAGSNVPKAATDLCGRCPVRDQCLDWAIDHDEYGVWAGTTREDREKIRRQRTVTHGTHHAYKAAGCRCEPCRAAASKISRQYRNRDAASTRHIARIPDPIRERIMAEWADGRTMTGIADGLNADGIPTAIRGVWRTTTIKRIVAAMLRADETAEPVR